MSERTRIVLKSGKDQSLRRYHPWVFSGAIKKIHGPAREGELVDIYDNKEEFLASGHYQEGSIAVRVISFESVETDQSFWEQKVSNAWNLRDKLGLTDNLQTNVFRWINAEGDGMPGLIVDYYGGAAVIQMHSIGMHRNLEAIVDAMKKAAGDRLHTIYNRSDSTLPDKPGITGKSGFLMGKQERGEVLENGYRFLVNWVEGQKTGFFIDQRENRKLVGEYSKGRKVLNMFGYTGGFSIYGMGGGARLVHTVDSSGKAIDLSRENAELNFPDDKRHAAFAVDAFGYFKEIKEAYDLIILDPPHLQSIRMC